MKNLILFIALFSSGIDQEKLNAQRVVEKAVSTKHDVFAQLNHSPYGDLTDGLNPFALNQSTLRTDICQPLSGDILRILFCFTNCTNPALVANNLLCREICKEILVYQRK
ncbi:MAG: hypothetical protein IPM48_06655 [Saprospiraceae bacterium]|nr:hypothetical protein [Saprospiraceae bacterium]